MKYVIIIVLLFTCGVLFYQLDRAKDWTEFYKNEAYIYKTAYERLGAIDRGDNSNYPFIINQD